MAKIFIHRPIFAIVISLLIVIIGLISAFSLPVAQYPQISPPTVSVSTTYVGANSDAVSQTVAQVIEKEVNGVEAMDYMTSASDDSGSYTLTVKFDLGTDGDIAAVKVQNKVSAATPSLPEEVKAFGVNSEKSSSDMDYAAAISSPNGTYDRVFLKNYADIYLLDAIKRIKGVGKVQVFASDYSMRVWVNPAKIADFDLTMTEVIQAIQSQNIQASAGTIGQYPTHESQEKQMSAHVKARLITPEQFGDIIVKNGDESRIVRLKDVARIDHGPRNTSYFSTQEKAPAVAFSISLTSDANATETIDKVNEVLKEAEGKFPPDMKLTTIIDSTKFIYESLNEVEHTFMEALALVIIIVFLFLQSVRATLIPILAVPVSLIGTFAAFVVLGFTINTLTLFAMVLAIGLVVDDAIVVIENVEHHMETEGLDSVAATEKAMEEVQGPVIAIACVLSAVFIPVAFLGGMTGVLYRQFALTIAVSMFLSAFIALTLTPALCATMLKGVTNEGKHKGFFGWFNRTFDAITNTYTGIVAKLVHFGKMAVIFLLLVCGMTYQLFGMLPSTFVPNEDKGYLMGAVALPPGSAMTRTEDTLGKLSDSIMKIDGVKDVITINGYDVMANGSKPNAGMLFIGLKEWSERTTNELSADSIANQIMGLGVEVAPEALVLAFQTPALPGLGNTGGFEMNMMDMDGRSNEELYEISQKIIEKANQRPELIAVTTTYDIKSPIYDLDFDRDRISNLGLDMKDVFTTMQVYFGGTEVNDFTEFGRNYKVVLQADGIYRDDVEALRAMYLRNANGEMVPFDTLVQPKLTTAPPIISRFNNSRSITFNGYAGEGYSSGDALKAIREVAEEVAPNGFMIEWGGQSREEVKAAGQTVVVMSLALIFVFLCLAALYESWSVPFAVLLTVPVAVFGALALEYICLIVTALDGYINPGFQNSIYMQIGIIMVIGLAAKNAILIVEFAKQRADAGMDFVEAAVESAKLRLRPILMTSLAFIIGCLPLAMAAGAGAASRNGMGTAVVGGMTLATVVGVFIIPVTYVAVMQLVNKFSKK